MVGSNMCKTVAVDAKHSTNNKFRFESVEIKADSLRFEEKVWRDYALRISCKYDKDPLIMEANVITQFARQTSQLLR